MNGAGKARGCSVNGGLICLFLGVALASGESHAQFLEQRCMTDSLSAPEAVARLLWARACAIQNHVRISNGDPIATESGELAADFTLLHDYIEIPHFTWTATMNFYSDPFEDGAVNETVRRHLFLTGSLRQSKDSNGWWQWWTDGEWKLRPEYPTYMGVLELVSDDSHPDARYEQRQLFPHPSLADCSLYLDPNGIERYFDADIPWGRSFFYHAGYCLSG